MGRSRSGSSDNDVYLNDQEIDEFLNRIDHEKKGYIAYKDVETQLDEAHDTLFRDNHFHLKHHAHRPQGGRLTNDQDGRHQFLHKMMGSADAERIPRQAFADLLRGWKVPSLAQAKKQEDDEKSYWRRLPGWRKVRAYWAVHGPEICFIALVIGMQLAFGIWQLVKYDTTPGYRAALGWGVVMAKTCAGALYPTFFFLILSMSRYASTWLRSSYHVSRFINWDLSQEFHIRISCVALLLATLHAIGHLTGSFVHGSDPANAEAVRQLFGQDSAPRSYIDYIRSLPGFTGITGLGLFYALSILSIPPIRRWNYEVFQLAHLLMFPIIGLMMAHGTAGLLQWPMFGYFLAVPTLLVLFERLVRVSLGFHRLKATLTVLDDETMEIMVNAPPHRLRRYTAGQYIFLQVPAISIFQWHPFTVSFCRGRQFMVHIKTDGNWTGKLRKLGGGSTVTDIQVGIDGPFGAPAQRFCNFKHSMIIGTGIGVTPFSGILADLQQNFNLDHQENCRDSASTLDLTHALNGTEAAQGDSLRPVDRRGIAHPIASKVEGVSPTFQQQQAHHRRVDFHWSVRDRNHLMWFSDLLNQVFLGQQRKASHDLELDIRINTHVTAKRKDIVVHVFRWLLENHRTDEHPNSPLTGLLNPTHFGRPNFDEILDTHYQDMRVLYTTKSKADNDGGYDSSATSNIKVGIFYCGSPAVGEILADKCRQLTVRGRHDGSKIAYHFITEVFA